MQSQDGVEADRTELELRPVHVPNGLAFSPDGRFIYAADSWPTVRCVWRYRWTEDGPMDEQMFFDTSDLPGRPDGAAVDSEGCYWLAAVGGGEILKISPEGRLIQRVALPVSHPTKLCFGGGDLRTIYVTSMGPLSGVAGIEGQHSGSIWSIRADVPGIAEPVVALPFQ